MNNGIKFHAEHVETGPEEYTPDYKVVGIYFGEGGIEKFIINNTGDGN